MAKRYGYGYSSDIDGAINSLRLQIMKACIEAWDLFCEKLQNEINALWDEWVVEIYQYNPEKYLRTYQLIHSECPIKVVSGASSGLTGQVVASLRYEDLGFTPSNPPYHVLEDGDTLDFINVVDAFHDTEDFIDYIKEYFGGKKWQ